MLRRMRGLQHPRAQVMPAAALTTFYGSANEQAVRAAGYQAYLRKPIAAEELAVAVSQLAVMVQ
jgi:CheY-like chemotaxis protein